MARLRNKIPHHSHDGIFRKTIATNKKYLREDFDSRCAYCDDSDFYFGSSSFHVDHFAPKSRFPEYALHYENLLYACPYCNRSKSDTWVGATAFEGVIGEAGFEKPTSHSYDSHFIRSEKGEIVPLDDLGRYMYKHLNFGLLRHSCLCRLEMIRTRIDQLDDLSRERGGEFGQKAQDLVRELKCLFYDYYIVMQSEDN